MPVVFDDTWLSREKAAERVGVSPRTIDNWRDRGLVTSRRTAGGAWRYLEASLWKEEDAPSAAAS